MAMTGRARSGLWLLLDSVSAAVFAFGFFVVTARLLTPLQFGIGALALSFAQILTPMIESLFHDALIQREDLDRVHLQTAATVTLGWALALALALWLLAPVAADLLAAPLLGACLPWMGLALVASGLMAVPAAAARRTMDFRLLAIRTVVARTIATAAGLTLAFLGAGEWAIVVQFVAAAVLSAAFLLFATRPSLRLGVDRTALREMIGFAAPAMGAQLLFFTNSRMVTLIVAGFMGPVAAGTWNVAVRFVEPLQTMAATILGQFALPIFARQQSDTASLAASFTSGSRRTAIVLVPLFIGLASLSEPVIRTFVGDRWLAAAPIMSIICVVMALIMTRALTDTVLSSIGAPKLNLLIQAQASVLALIGVAAGAAFGLLAVAIGWSLRALPVITGVILLRRRIGLGIRAQFAAPASAFLAAGAMAAAIAAVRLLVPLPALPVLVLAILVPLGAVVYALTLWLADRHFRSDTAAIAAALRRRRTSPATHPDTVQSDAI